MKNILITGGAGFIGSHVVRLFVNKYPNYNIFNLDTLTYAGNLENLKEGKYLLPATPIYLLNRWGRVLELNLILLNIVSMTGCRR